MKTSLIVLFTLLCLPLLAGTEPTLPPPTGQAMSDFAGLLTPGQAQQVARKLHAFRGATTAQVAVVTVPAGWPGDLPLDAYAHQLARNWQLGEKGKDNGVLFLVVGTPSDRQGRGVRFEVGYGLEGALPDITCKRIQAERVVPHLKSRRYFAAIDGGTDAILEAISGEYASSAASATEKAAPAATDGFWFRVGQGLGVLLLCLVVGGFVTGIVLAVRAVRRVGRPAQRRTSQPPRVLSSTQAQEETVIPPGQAGKPEYVGRWEGNGLVLTIEPHGNGVYQGTLPGQGRQGYGFVRFTKEGIYLMNGPSWQLCSVDQPPYPYGEHWQMQLNGVLLSRVPAVQPVAPLHNTTPGTTSVHEAALAAVSSSTFSSDTGWATASDTTGSNTSDASWSSNSADGWSNASGSDWNDTRYQGGGGGFGGGGASSDW